MKKSALLLAVIMAVSLCGVLWADDDEHPVPSPIDDYIGDTDLLRDNPEIKERIHNQRKNPARKNESGERKSDESAVSSGEWHPDAKYRVTDWTENGNMLILKVEDRKGSTSTLKGIKGTLKNERKVNLQDKLPIQFTVPEWVEVVHVWKDTGYNYEITEGGKLKPLPVKGDGRMAYPDKTILVKQGSTMTVWLLQ